MNFNYCKMNFFSRAKDVISQLLNLKKGIQHYADCIIRNEKGQLLLLQRSYQDDFQPGKWCLPGGKIEPGEYPEYAAARELLEETNLQIPLEFIQAVERDDSVSLYFEGYVHTQQYPILDNNEHYRLEWVDVDKIAQYDLILDLKDILTNKIGLPIYSTKLMELDIFDANDLFKRNELVEKSFNEDQMSVKEYFSCKEIIKSHLDEIIKAAQEQGLLEKGGKRAVIGEKRTFGGREYIKTSSGWKFHGKGTGAKAQEHVAGTRSAEIKPVPFGDKVIIDEVKGIRQSTKEDNNVYERSLSKRSKKISSLLKDMELQHYDDSEIGELYGENDEDDSWKMDNDKELSKQLHKIKIQALNPNDVKSSEWNENTTHNKKSDRYSKLDFNNMPPIISTIDKNGRIEAINGIHRVFAGQKAKNEIPAIIIPKDVWDNYFSNYGDTRTESYLLEKLKNHKLPKLNKIEDKEKLFTPLFEGEKTNKNTE